MSAESGQDKEAKTEQPTQKRARDALKKGQVIASKEVYSFFSILGFFICLIFLLPGIATKYALYLRGVISNAGDFIVVDGYLGRLMQMMLGKIMWICIPFFLILLTCGIIANFAHHFRFVLSLHTLQPRLSALSPIKGLQRIFSFKNFIELCKSCLKILIVGSLLYFLVKSGIKYLPIYIDLSAQAIVKTLYNKILLIAGFASLIIGIGAVADYLFQRREYFTNLKMTKQEIKDEYREAEGDPETKRRIRRQMIKQLRYSVVVAIQKADVLLTNPDHVAIALEYKAKLMNAPCVTAKGLGEVAMHMKHIAKESGVVIIENKKLARSLYSSTEINQTIAPKYYDAVAQVIGYAYDLTKKRKKW